MENRCALCVFSSAIFIAAAFSISVQLEAAAESGTLLTGKAANGDWKSDAPGVRRKITVEDLPAPSSNVLAINPPRVTRRPADAQPQVPSGFKIDLYASGFRDPRFLLSAPNGDIFVVESRANRIKVLRDTKGMGKPGLYRRTRPRLIYVFTPATNSRPNTKAPSSLRSMVHGTG